MEPDSKNVVSSDLEDNISNEELEVKEISWEVPAFVISTFKQKETVENEALSM